MKFNYYFTFFILCFFYIQDIFGNITYQKIIDQQCKLKKYETNIGLFTIANCFNNKLRNEVYVFLNDKNIFYDEMKLDYKMPKRQDNFILFSGIAYSAESGGEFQSNSVRVSD